MSHPRSRPVERTEEGPLLEIRPSTRNLEVDRVDERLVVSAERIELRDRHDAVIRTLAIGDVNGLKTRRRFGTVSITIDGGAAGDISMRGLHPDQVARLRELIEGPLGASPDEGLSTVIAFGSRVANRPPRSPTYADVLRQLEALAQVGLLDDQELAEKRAQLARNGVRSAPRSGA